MADHFPGEGGSRRRDHDPRTFPPALRRPSLPPRQATGSAAWCGDMNVPLIRIRAANDKPLNPQGAFVLLWMTAARRTRWNFGLDHAISLAEELGRPLVILEAIRSDYPYASDRFHAFILQGMADNARRLAGRRVTYHAYVEPQRSAGHGLLEALAAHACAVVSDWSPAFFLPRMVAAAAAKVPVRMEKVDSCGLLPLAATDAPFPLAHSFRRFLQKNLPPHRRAFPSPDPTANLTLPRLERLPAGIADRWPAASNDLLAGSQAVLAGLPIDHKVAPTSSVGGSSAAEAALETFLRHGLDRYDQDRNHPDLNASSGLSPWLHFGHISAHQVVHGVLEKDGWDESRLAKKPNGSREGWWGLPVASEAFLDQLITWRELGYVQSHHAPNSNDYESLPAWARETLEKHASDPREHVYGIDDFDRGRTHDPLWNAAQNELRSSGRMHNYLRMLWGKKILEGSAHPRDALATMLRLNDRYALDGRDPNSVSGIFWVLGRYDRPWGPERPIFGAVRYMTSGNTMRKLRAKRYLARWAQGREG